MHTHFRACAFFINCYYLHAVSPITPIIVHVLKSAFSDIYIDMTVVFFIIITYSIFFYHIYTEHSCLICIYTLISGMAGMKADV